jgi:hypothetical protein
VLRGYYEPAWVVLRELATLPFELVAILRFLADERAAGYLQVDQLNRTLNKIPWVRLEVKICICMNHLRNSET